MKFLVIVTCAVAGHCPIPGEYKLPITAASSKACYALAYGTIAQLGYSPKGFKVVCRPQ